MNEYHSIWRIASIAKGPKFSIAHGKLCKVPGGDQEFPPFSRGTPHEPQHDFCWKGLTQDTWIAFDARRWIWMARCSCRTIYSEEMYSVWGLLGWACLQNPENRKKNPDLGHGRTHSRNVKRRFGHARGKFWVWFGVVSPSLVLLPIKCRNRQWGSPFSVRHCLLCSVCQKLFFLLGGSSQIFASWQMHAETTELEKRNEKHRAAYTRV